MSAISAAVGGLSSARALFDVATRYLSEGAILPEVVAAQSSSEQQIAAETSILKDALAAESQVLDLLA